MTKVEELLNALINGETLDIEPRTRVEAYLKNCCEGCGCDGLPTPITPTDALLYALAEKLAGGGSGGGDLDALIDGTLTEITSNVNKVKANAFEGHSTIKSAKLPNVTRIGRSAFEGCKALVSIDCPKLEIIEGNAFNECSNLESVSFPMCNELNSTNVFYKCSKLVTVYLPNIDEIQGNTFANCNALKNVTVTNATYVGSRAFSYCYSLVTIDLPKCRYFGSNANFTQARSLRTVILRSEEVAVLGGADIFSGCYHFEGKTDSTYNPEGLKDGYIYVPRALVEDYKAATNWSTYATQFRALEDYTVDGTITGELDETKI